MRAILVALSCLAVAAAAGAEAPQPDPYGVIDQVPYYMAAGELAGSHLQVAGKELDFEGCAYMQLRPWRYEEDPQTGEVAKVFSGEHNGVVRVVGVIDGLTPVQLIVNTLRPSPRGDPDLALNTSVRAFGEEPAHAPAFGLVEGWGEAQLRVHGTTYADPARKGPEKTGGLQNRTLGHFFVTSTGFRDDATGAIQEPGTDTEMHLHIESFPGQARDPEAFRMGPASDVPLANRLLPTEAHSSFYPFSNTHFGGVARLRFEAEADAPAGANEFRFRVLSPSGAVLANSTLAPAVQDPKSAEATIALDEFGTYSIHVAGKASMAMYSVSGVLEPPETFAMDLWWEEQSWGLEAARSHEACKRALNSGIPPIVVTRAQPPQYDLPAVALGVSGAIVAVVVFVGLVVAMAASSRFRRKYRS